MCRDCACLLQHSELVATLLKLHGATTPVVAECRARASAELEAMAKDKTQPDAHAGGRTSQAQALEMVEQQVAKQVCMWAGTELLVVMQSVGRGCESGVEGFGYVEQQAALQVGTGLLHGYVECTPEWGVQADTLCEMVDTPTWLAYAVSSEPSLASLPASMQL